MDITCINGTASPPLEWDANLAPLPHLIAGVTIFFFTLPCLLYQLRSVPMGSTVAVLLGSFLMVLAQVLPQGQVYDILSQSQYLSCIFLLIAIMILAQYFNREQFFINILRKLLKPEYSFTNYIWRISLTVCLVSALFTSDAACAILTPVILRIWEAQDRCNLEINTIILAIATSANIGSVLTVFGSPHIALIASTTSLTAYRRSSLTLRTCFVYMGPCVLVAFLLNLTFLIAHYKFRTLHSDKTQLLSEVSHSEQEMASLTSNGAKSPVNGFAHYIDDEDMQESEQETNCDVTEENEAPCVGGGYRESNTPPCTLETIPEDEILEINSEGPSGHSLSSLRALSGADVNCDLSAIDTMDNENNDSSEDIHNLDVNIQPDDIQSEDREDGFSRGQSSERGGYTEQAYEPSPLSSGVSDFASNQHAHHLRPWTGSKNTGVEQYGFLVSKKCGIYRNFSGISAVQFLSPNNGKDTLSESFQNSAGASKMFRILCCSLLLTILVLLSITDLQVTFDIGLVPLAAAAIALAADAILNNRVAMATAEQLDWSVVLLFYGIFVWMNGFMKTNVTRWIWDKLVLTHSDYNNFSSIAFLCVFVLIGTNLSSSFIVTIILLQQLIPCQNQLSMVLFLTWTSSIAGNMTLFGSVSNFIVIHKAQSVTRYRMSLWSHFQFGFLTSLLLLPIGILLLYGLLQIPGIQS